MKNLELGILREANSLGHHSLLCVLFSFSSQSSVIKKENRPTRRVLTIALNFVMLLMDLFTERRKALIMVFLKRVLEEVE